MILKDKNKIQEEDLNNNDDVIVIEQNDDSNDNDNVVNTVYVNDDSSNYENNQPIFKNKIARIVFLVIIAIIFLVILILILSACNAGKIKGFTISKIPTLYTGEEFDLKIVPDSETKKTVKYKFKIDDDSVVKVKYAVLKGKVVKNTLIPVNAGETTLNIKAGKKTGTNKLVVCNHLDKELVDKNMTVKMNKTYDLDLGVGNSKKCYSGLSVKVDDEDMIEVDGFQIKAKKAGNTFVTVSDETTSVKINVKVSTKNIYISSLDSSVKNAELKIGDSTQLNVSIKPDNATNKELEWSSSNKSVAEVSEDGVVKAKKAGSTTIKAVTSDGSGKSISFKIKVIANNDSNNNSNSGSSNYSNNSNSNSDSSNENSSNKSSKVKKYEYQPIITTKVPVSMCKYQRATSYNEYYYSIVSSTNSDLTTGYVSNSIGVRLSSNDVSNIKVSAVCGSEYFSNATYCSQRVNNSKSYWPGNNSVMTSCSVPGKIVSSVYFKNINISSVSKGNRYSNGYDIKYSYNFNYNTIKNAYGSLISLPIRFNVKYTGYGTQVSGKCTSVGANDKIISRYTEYTTTTTYGNYAWTTNPKLANAKYTGRTKLE